MSQIALESRVCRYSVFDGRYSTTTASVPYRFVAASTAMVDGQTFFELFRSTITYRKMAGLTRGQQRIVTDEQGRYRIDRVPPGTYTVVAWYEGVRQQSQTVTLTGDGRTVESDFTLR